jgi:hypothetical protein
LRNASRWLRLLAAAAGSAQTSCSGTPEIGKTHIVQNGIIRPKEVVLEEWPKTLFLRSESLETCGWLLDVMNA